MFFVKKKKKKKKKEVATWTPVVQRFDLLIARKILWKIVPDPNSWVDKIFIKGRLTQHELLDPGQLAGHLAMIIFF